MNPLEPVTGEAVNEVDLPLAGGPVDGRLAQEFSAENLPSLRHAVRNSARAAGFTGDGLDDFVLAVHELATNAVRHGGGRGRLELRPDGDSLVCEVTDHGPGFGDGIPAAGRAPSPDRPGGRGLWLARCLSDTLLITDGPGGVTVSITVCLPGPQPGGVLMSAALSEVSTAATGLGPAVLVPPATGRRAAPPIVAVTGPDAPDGGRAVTGSLGP